MADYCIYDDMDNEIADLTDHVPTGKVAAVWVGAQIDKAESEIDGRLGSRYTVPFTTVPALITTIAIYLATSRILNPGFIGEIPADSKVVDTYYKRADDLLKRLESGELVLETATESTDDTASPQSSTSSQTREFTQNILDSDGDVSSYGSMDGW